MPCASIVSQVNELPAAWISAFNFGGVPRRIIEMGISGDIRLAISGDLLAEVSRVQTEKFKWAPDRLKEWEHDILTFTEKVQPVKRVDVISADPTDNRILECAVAAGADYIVTGDKHLLRLLAFTKGTAQEREISVRLYVCFVGQIGRT